MKLSNAGRVAGLLCVVAVAVVFAAVPAQAAASKHCGNAFAGPDDPGFSIVVTHFACSTARRFTRQLVREGQLGPRRCPTYSSCGVAGFRCRARRTGDLYRQRCVRGRQVFSFGGGS